MYSTTNNTNEKLTTTTTATSAAQGLNLKIALHEPLLFSN
jgi:hypothetical protein